MIYMGVSITSKICVAITPVLCFALKQSLENAGVTATNNLSEKFEIFRILLTMEGGMSFMVILAEFDFITQITLKV